MTDDAWNTAITEAAAAMHHADCGCQDYGNQLDGDEDTYYDMLARAAATILIAHGQTTVPDAAQAENKHLRALLNKLVDDNPCTYDHDGDCQEHGFTLNPGETCPNQAAHALLDNKEPQ